MRSVLLACFLVVVALLAPPVAAAQPRGRAGARFVVSPHEIVIDQPVRIRVDGLRPFAAVQITMTIVGGGQTIADGKQWMSHATFIADRAGRVDVDRQAPVSGDYIDRAQLLRAHVPGRVAESARGCGRREGVNTP